MSDSRDEGGGGFLESATDTFTETTTTSWFERIKNAFVGIVGGLVLLAVGIGGLFWNEGRAVQTARSLTEGGRAVVSVDSASVDPSNEGKLIHITGPVKTVAPLRDADFGVSATGVRLSRRVEMYQWKEEKREEKRKNLGGSEETVTTYSYRREWEDHRIDSGRFRQADGHRNPEMRFQSRDVIAQDAMVGAFRAGEPVLRQIRADEALRLEGALASDIRARMSELGSVTSERIYLGSDPSNPRIGDIRVTYTIARPAEMSVIGQQSGGGFTSYQAKAGDKLLMASAGQKSAAEMFKAAEDFNTFVTWLIRALAALGILIGFTLILRPLAVIGDVVPIVGSLIGAGTGLVALLLTAVVAPIVIAAAWFYYRPLVAILVLAGGAALAYAIKVLAAKRAATRSAPSPARASA